MCSVSFRAIKNRSTNSYTLNVRLKVHSATWPPRAVGPSTDAWGLMVERRDHTVNERSVFACRGQHLGQTGHDWAAEHYFV